jgi:hypothetical protein
MYPLLIGNPEIPDDEILPIPFAIYTNLDITSRTGQPMSIDPRCRIRLRELSMRSDYYSELSPMWTEGKDSRSAHDGRVSVEPYRTTENIRWTWELDELCLKQIRGIKNVAHDGHILVLTDRVSGLSCEVPFCLYGDALSE